MTNMGFVGEFMMWCTIINGALLILSSLVCASAGNWIYRLHGRWFQMSRESFNVSLYTVLGLFKILFLMFNLVPFIALVIISR